MIAYKRAPRAVASARGAKDAPPNRPANWAHSVRDAAGALPLHPREDIQMFHVKHRGASAQLAASLNGKKASNSEEISRLDRVRRKAARKNTLTNRRYAQGGFLLPLRSARAIPNSMPFCHSLPYRLLNQDRHAPPRAASPVGRLAIGRDGLLADGRRGLPSRRRAFAGRADPGYVNSGLTAEGRWADRNGPQKGAHAARCAGSGMSDAVGCRIGEAKGSG